MNASLPRIWHQRHGDDGGWDGAEDGGWDNRGRRIDPKPAAEPVHRRLGLTARPASLIPAPQAALTDRPDIKHDETKQGDMPQVEAHWGDTHRIDDGGDIPVTRYTARDVALPAPAIGAELTGGEVLELFSAHPSLPIFAVVESDGSLIGVVERDRLLFQFSQPLWYDVYNRRPIAPLINQRPLAVDGDTTIDRLKAMIAFDHPEAIGTGFVIMENGRYAAIGTMMLLLERTVEQAHLHAVELEAARRRAASASKAKSQFLATMSHELRTPLNAILGFSEVMKNEIFGAHANTAYKEYSSDIHGSGQHLLNLINEILDLSRIEAGRYELNEEAISLMGVVDDCRHMLAMRAKAKGQTIRELAEPELPRVWADERAIRQVVLNILSNAIKFTPQGGEISIKIGWTAAGGQYVTVTDTGPGIPENEIPIVMQSFGRGSLAIKTAEQGSGLGLPIVKGLIELHGGGFHLKSKPRAGTEVTITLPAERVMDALPALPEPRVRAA